MDFVHRIDQKTKFKVWAEREISCKGRIGRPNAKREDRASGGRRNSRLSGSAYARPPVCPPAPPSPPLVASSARVAMRGGAVRLSPAPLAAAASPLPQGRATWPPVVVYCSPVRPSARRRGRMRMRR